MCWQLLVFYICGIRCNVSFLKKKKKILILLSCKTKLLISPLEAYSLSSLPHLRRYASRNQKIILVFIPLACSRHPKHQTAFPTLPLYYFHSTHFLPRDCHHLSLSTIVISCLDYCNSLQTGLLVFPLSPLNLPPQHKRSFKTKNQVRLFPFLVKVFSLFLKL